MEFGLDPHHAFMPRSTRASLSRFDLGVLVVHGIGKQTQGQTLRDFTEPLLLELHRAALVEVDVEDVIRRPCEGRCVRETHTHIEIVLTKGQPSLQWVVVECFWDPLVTRLDERGFNKWRLSAFLGLAIWQISAAARAGFARIPRGGAIRGFFAFYAWLCRMFFSIFIRYLIYMVVMGLATLALLPERPAKDQKRSKVEILLRDTIGDAYAFSMDERARKAISDKFRSQFQSLESRCAKVGVVAHSQGAAIAHATMKARELPPDFFIAVGSGLGPVNAAQLNGGRRSSEYGRAAAYFVSFLAWFLAGTVIGTALSALTVFLVLIVLTLIIGVMTLLTVVFTALSHGDVASVFSPFRSYGLVNWGDVAQRWEFFLLQAIISSILMLGFASTLGYVATKWLGLPSVFTTSDFVISQRRVTRWYEIYSPLDPVSVGSGINSLAQQTRVYNQTGWRLWREHTSYFKPDSAAMGHIAVILARHGDVPGSPPPPPRRIGFLVKRAFFSTLPVVSWLYLYMRGSGG